MAEQKTVAHPDEKQAPASYHIDVNEAKAKGRALPVLIASKRCYACVSADDDEPNQASDMAPYIERIEDHCAETPDYLPDDTPLKEALFKAILSSGNKPMTVEELSAFFREKWAMTPNPRDISAEIIQKVLGQGGSYCISPFSGTYKRRRRRPAKS